MIKQEITEAAFHGEKIQYLNNLNEWEDLGTTDEHSFYFYLNGEFRIKPQPYRQEYEIWLSGVPDPTEMSLNMGNHILGYGVDWAFGKTDNCTKKFRIIVEEVEET